jgi:hypothetical protein
VVESPARLFLADAAKNGMGYPDLPNGPSTKGSGMFVLRIDPKSGSIDLCRELSLSCCPNAATNLKGLMRRI